MTNMYFLVNSSDRGQPKLKPHTFCTTQCLKETVDGRLQCKCGEDTAVYDWVWQDQQSKNVKMSNEDRDVLFHPVYSSGTAIVRGQLPFQQNYHYYWEIKMISKLYGTDVMIGIGTSKVILEDCQLKFCSLLGIDSESWGYSYQGIIQHNKLRRKYGKSFGLGSIIGVHLDMCNGTLEYFLNRKPLGIAFRDLKGKELYPMVCSTAAHSSIRITCCMSKEPSLQMMCLKLIMHHPGMYKEYRDIPGLSKIYDKQFFWMQPQVSKETEEKKRLAELDEDVSLSLVDRSYFVKNKKFRAIRLISLLYEQELENIQNDSDLDVYDEQDFNLVAKSSQEIEETNGPSTSSGSSSSHMSESVASSKIFPMCCLCLSKAHESEDCLLKTSSDDSDTDSETSGLSKIL